MKHIRKYIYLFVLNLIVISMQAQSSGKSFSAFKQHEDSMKTYAFNIVNAREAADRFRSDSIFTKMLVRALKEPHSFYYPFDSLQTISRLYAPDSSFRIFTWQVVKDENTFRRHGAIQINTKDGSLQLYPLLDKTPLLTNTDHITTTNMNWVGAIYYRILENNYNGKKYYTLFGYDENNIRSTKKRIEVLHFDEQGRPVFGGPFFSFAKDQVPKPVQTRFTIEYKKEGNASIRYDDEMKMIIYDHLISENNQPEKKYTYIPDGDYEGFKWENGKWLHVDKVFTYKLQDGQAPVEKPLKEGKFDFRQ
ncbi:MAG: hypothetical protein JST63_15495 [Bacteroidetes bacterium]|nr:hypothetical protein [Bacteroidota bacterium]